MITMSFIDLKLFDNKSIIEKCILKNKYEIKIMIDNNSNEYEFVNFVIAHEICEILKCVFVKLMKYKIVKKYDKKKIQSSRTSFISK